MKEQLIYKDSGDNKLYIKFIKTRNTYQLYGKNAEGRLINEQDINILVNRAKRAGIKIKNLRPR